MRRLLAIGTSYIIAATAIHLSSEAQQTRPTVTVEYHIDDASWRLTPFVQDVHRVVAEVFSTYGILVQRASTGHGQFHIELLADSAYECTLTDEIAREPDIKGTAGYAPPGNRAFLRTSTASDALDTCLGGVVVDLAEVVAHEIGHLLGLKHLETKELGVNTINLMDDDALRSREYLCTYSPSEIKSGDLDVSLTPEQVKALYKTTQHIVVRDALPAVQDPDY